MKWPPCRNATAKHRAQSSEIQPQLLGPICGGNKPLQSNCQGALNLPAAAAASHAPVAEMLAIVSQYVILIFTDSRTGTLHDLVRREYRFGVTSNAYRSTRGKPS